MASLGARNDVALAGLNPQDGLSRHHQLRAQLRRAGRRSRLARRRAAPGARLHVPHDERGAHRRRPRRRDARVQRLSARAGLRARAAAGAARPPARIRSSRRSGSSSMPTCGACCWRRRPTSRAAWRCACMLRVWSTTSYTGETERCGSEARAAARHPDADRQVVAVAVLPGGQQPGDPGAWRLRLHARVSGRAVLPRQPAQPDPRRHPRHPGPGSARTQGRHAGRRRAAAADARDRTATVREARECDSPELRGYAEDLATAWTGSWRPRAISCARPANGEVDLALANASVYLEMVGHIVVAWMWLRQALVAVAKLPGRTGRRSRLLPGQAAGVRLLLPLGAAARPGTRTSCSTAWTGPASRCRTPGSRWIVDKWSSKAQRVTREVIGTFPSTKACTARKRSAAARSAIEGGAKSARGRGRRD